MNKSDLKKRKTKKKRSQQCNEFRKCNLIFFFRFWIVKNVKWSSIWKSKSLRKMWIYRLVRSKRRSIQIKKYTNNKIVDFVAYEILNTQIPIPKMCLFIVRRQTKTKIKNQK